MGNIDRCIGIPEVVDHETLLRAFSWVGGFRDDLEDQESVCLTG